MTRKPAQPVNVAVVGLGFMGVTHLRSYLSNPGARIVAVCDATRLPEKGVLRGVAGNIKKSGDIRLDTQVKVYRQFAELLTDLGEVGGAVELTTGLCQFFEDFFVGFVFATQLGGFG